SGSRRIVAVDVAEDGREAAARLRHLTALLRAAPAAAGGEGGASRLARRLTAHAFCCNRPLRPGAVVELVLGLDGPGPDRTRTFR
ncbi:MAG: hypothetical protein FWJ61_06935, partial [Limnochordales bacterium]